jgi:hypothetical protein
MRTSWVRFPPRALTKLQVRGCFLRSGLVALGRDISRRATKSRSRAGDSQRALSGLDVCGGSRPTSSERSSRCAVSGRMSGRVDPRESAQRRDEQHGRGRGARPARQATLASVFRPALPVFSYADQRLRMGCSVAKGKVRRVELDTSGLVGSVEHLPPTSGPQFIGHVRVQR